MTNSKLDASSTTRTGEDTVAPSIQADKKRKKRNRNSDEEEVEAITASEPSEALVAEGGPAKKKKKRKSDGQKEVGVEQQAEGDEHDRSSAATSTQSKKKEKKRKDKQRATSNVPIDPQLAGQGGQNENQNQNQNQTNAFLSAVMAAAAAVAAHQEAPPSQTTPEGAGLPPQPPPPPHYGYPHYPVPYPMAVYPPGSLPPPSGNQPPPLMFPSPYAGAAPGFSLPDAVFASLGLGNGNGEEIVRALQGLDLTKIADVLRSLGDAAANASSSFPLPGQQGQFQGPTSEANPNMPLLLQQFQFHPGAFIRPPINTSTAGPINQLPAPSAMILGQQKGPTAVPVESVALNQNPEHAHTLSTKWINATKLAEFVRKHGLVYKKGKFSAVEEATLKHAIERFRQSRNLTDQQLHELIFAKAAKSKNTPFWSEITSQLEQRPIIAVYHHVRRMYHPLKHRGKWTPQEDETLRQVVIEYGAAWEKASILVGRMASDCRDRWRNHINNRETRVMGSWSKAEEEKLTQIVTEMTIAQGKDADNDVFWTTVAEMMGNSRGRQQCRIKWTDSLSKTVKNAGQKPRWSQKDAYILVHKIASLNVRDDTEIDWKLLNDADWNLWSAHSLQRRWLTLKRGVRGYEEMTHQEIMDILKMKKASAPPSPGPVRKSRVTSTALVPTDAPSTDSEVGPIAGPSNIHTAPEQDPETAPLKPQEPAANGVANEDNEGGSSSSSSHSPSTSSDSEETDSDDSE